jgi:hypothetical protein
LEGARRDVDRAKFKLKKISLVWKNCVLFLPSSHIKPDNPKKGAGTDRGHFKKMYQRRLSRECPLRKVVLILGLRASHDTCPP